MQLPYLEMGKIRGRVDMRNNQELGLNMLNLRCLSWDASKEVRWAGIYSLVFRRRAKGWMIHEGVFHLQIVFKTVQLNKITKAVP